MSTDVLHRHQARRLIGPGIATLVMLVLLIGLGVWQVQRLAWKEGLLAQIDRAEASPAVPLGEAPPGQFAKVRVTGRLDATRSVLYGAEVRSTEAGPQMGGQLLQPLDRPGQLPVLVDRGWVPSTQAALIAAPIDQPAGEVTIDGYARQPETPGWLSARDDAATDRFYTLNPAAIGSAMGLREVAPFVLVALGTPPPQGLPEPATALPRPPNNHLSYAVTWFGLAAILLAIFLIWSRKVLRP